MKKLTLILFILVAVFICFGFQGKSSEVITIVDDNFYSPATNFTGADLTGANLKGVSLDGVILCNTIMPDGRVNNSSCKN